MPNSLKYENGDIIEIKIDYQKEIVKFNGTICDKTSMFLREFAKDVLKINAETKEFMALDLLIQGVFRHSVNIKLAASVNSLLILLMSIKTDVCGEIADLFILKVLALVLIPAERIRISVMQNIPEVGLCVAPKNIIHLIAAARGKIEVGFG